MFCPDCGKELPNGSRFCGNCGASLASVPQPGVPAGSGPPSDAVSPAPKKKRKWLLPLILVLVLAAAAAVFLLWFFGDGRAYGQAQALYEQGEYTQAESAFRALGDYKDSAARVDDCRYQQAKAAYDKGNYALAQAMFEAMGDYADSPEQVKACRYQMARQFFEKGDTDTAAELFEALGDYKDSADWLLKCRPASPAGTWTGQVNLVEAAGDQLVELREYLKDVNVDFILELREDNTFTLRMDATTMMPVLKDAFRAYLNDLLGSMGMSLEEFESAYGQSIDALIDEALAEADLDALTRSVDGTYAENGGRLTLTANDGSWPIEGTWDGDSMTLHDDDIGDIRFTRR